jgi:hypothetical protein
MYSNIQKLKQDNPGKYINAGKPWTSENLANLLADVQKKKTHEEMSDIHGRTVGGIISRLKDIAADYYLNNKMPMKEIEKYTGLSTEVINQAIERKQQKLSYLEKKITNPFIQTPVAERPVSNPPRTQVPQIDSLNPDVHETLKELLVVAKDIQRMMKDFHADTFISKP